MICEERAILIYVTCQELLDLMGYEDDPQAQMTSAEVMTFCILAAEAFQSNFKKASFWLTYTGYFTRILSNGRLHRRALKIPPEAWNLVARLLASLATDEAQETCYAVDSFPVPCCQKNRIDARSLYIGKRYISWAPSKKQYFCGIKVHMLVSLTGMPIEFCFRPANEPDINVLWSMELDLPKHCIIYADAAYASEELRNLLFEDEKLCLLAQVKSRRSKKQLSKRRRKEINTRRQAVETVFSNSCRRFPRAFQVRTERGMELRITCSILAYSFSLIR